MPPPAQPRVTVLAPTHSALAAALRGALTERGWVLAARGTGREPAGPVVVVLEDDDGQPWGPPRALRPERTIGIGSVHSAAVLSSLALRGGVVLDQDVPFLTLLRLVEVALLGELGPPRAEERATTAARVRERAAEARAIDGLTERERDVLCGLLNGLSAAEIAAQGSRSLATVRSQIQSLTRRLGVSSQLAAVAMVHRAGHQARSVGCLESLHQF